jgi:hypothetical protein
MRGLERGFVPGSLVPWLLGYWWSGFLGFPLQEEDGSANDLGMGCLYSGASALFPRLLPVGLTSWCSVVDQ